MATRKVAARLHRLTVREVLGAGDGDHSDGGGLLLRVRGESSSWVLRFTSPSSQRREMGLGAAWRDSLAQAGDGLTGARDQAHKARELLRQGIDPIDARDRERAALQAAQAAAKVEKVRKQWTLARCARDFHARVIEPTRTDKHAAQWIASLENHMPPRVWHRPIDEIDAPELLQALTAIRPHEQARNLSRHGKPLETIKRVRQRLDAIFEDAMFHRRCASNPAAAVRRKMREIMPRNDGGQFAALPYADAPDFMRRLREAEGTAARCLEFAVLTAARTGEALGAQWSEFDLNARTWLCPPERMKASGKDRAEPHLVHLSPRAIEILRGQIGMHKRQVFASGRDDKPQLSNMAMLAVLTRMGERHRTTVHGIARATFSTWAYETAAARGDVIEACLAHREADRVKAAYNRARFNSERRELLEAWAAYLSGQVAATARLRLA